MAPRRCIYEITGIISDILKSDTAIINFTLDGKQEKALMKKDKFYHNGKIVQKDDGFDNFIAVGTEVKFSGHNWECAEFDECHWYVTMCWTTNCCPEQPVSIKSGLMFVTGQVSNLNGRVGVLALYNNDDEASHRILFIASKLFINEKRFAGKCLTEVLKIHDVLSFDAIPCIPEENDEGCEWFATGVYRGKRPKLNYLDKTNNNQSFFGSANGHGNDIPKLNFRVKCSNLIDEFMHNPRTLFVIGKGMIVDILNEEWGVMLGEFRQNHYQTMMFHRRSVFLYKMCLSRNNLADIFSGGDRVKFVAVGAPPGFPTDWIAVQVSVYEADNGSAIDTSSQNNEFC